MSIHSGPRFAPSIHPIPRAVRIRPFIVFLTALLLVLAPGGTRSEPAGSADPLARIESLRPVIEAGDLEEPQREEALAALDAAAIDERAASEARATAARLRAEAARLDGARTRAERAPVENGSEALRIWTERLPSDPDVDLLEGLLERQRERVSELSAEIEQAETELARILSQPAESSLEITALRRRADSISTASARDPNAPPLLNDARELRQLAERHRIEAELELRRTEQETSLERQRMQERALSELKLEQAGCRERIGWLQTRVAERTRELLSARVDAVRAAAEAEAARGGVVVSVASETVRLAEELLDQNDRLAAERAELSRIEQARDRVIASLQDSRTRLELGAVSEAAGRWLWSERRRLESPVRLERLRETRSRDLVELRLRRVALSDAQRALGDLPAAAKALVEERRGEAEDEAGLVGTSEAIEPWLRRRAELLALLDPIVQRRTRTLEQSEQVLQSQLETTIELRRLLDRHLLWTPSHAPIDSSWLGRVPEGLSDLLKPSRLATTARLTGEAIAARPIVTAGGLLLLVVLVDLRRRAPKRIEEQAAIPRRIRGDHIGATLVAFGWTLAAALPGPAALFLLGSLLQTAGTPGRYSDSLGRTCLELAAPLLAVQVLRWTSIEHGLGHAHFRWTRARRTALRRVLPATAVVVLPLDFVAVLAFIRNLDLPNDVQARAAIAIACAAMAVAFWWLFDVGRVWVLRGVESEPSKLRRIVRLGLPISLLGTAGLALSGYVYSAGLLLQSLLDSIAAVVAVTLVVGLLGRWFLVGERRLALRRLEERSAAESTGSEGGGEHVESPITLEQVNAQTQSILRVVRIGLLAASLLWVWADVLPAITRFDAIVLWTFSDTDADGVVRQQPVSLLAVLLGLLALALAVIGSRNLPGLVELVLLARTSVDAATRYAVSSLLRYVIAIAGTVIGLELFGLRWSQLQWMAAALTVGLGFGLQEIFANFVSGLILLFERPFRVGDVITVGDLSGRVTRIRTRATTILDFDNREIVVPNKSFITGQLVNWTLSDTTTRIIVKVGVAYGTDPDRVHALLLEAARSQAQVLADPGPSSFFLAFGASSLDFELRVFVGALADRLPVQSALHREIARRFAEAGIVIAFPQMDVHVRDLPKGVGSG